MKIYVLVVNNQESENLIWSVCSSLEETKKEAEKWSRAFIEDDPEFKYSTLAFIEEWEHNKYNKSWFLNAEFEFTTSI